MKLAQFGFEKRMNLAGHISDVNREAVFIHADSVDAFAADRHQSNLQEVVGDGCARAILQITFRNVGFGIEQRSSQVLGSASQTDFAQVRAVGAAFAVDGVASRAALFSVKLLATSRVTSRFFNWKLAEVLHESRKQFDLRVVQP